MDYKRISCFLILVVSLFSPFLLEAQITANADGSVATSYSSGTQDTVYVFCAAPDEQIGELTAAASDGGIANFEWLKYNSDTGSFDSYLIENSGNTFSTISGLSDGGYRVNITEGANTETYTAWVFNNWYTAKAEIGKSTCEYFQLIDTVEQAQMIYYDLSDGNPRQVFKDVKTKWIADGVQVALGTSPTIYSPPAKNTDYTLTVSDQFGCSVEVTVTYQSVVTKASFTFVVNSDKDGENYEAPAETDFTSTSLNADQYEWFFFRDRDELVREGETGTVTDSIMLTAIDPNPTIVYDHSGKYMVKLVTTKNSDNFACADTFYLDNYIVVDTSYIKAPNVFTPNGDGVNDEFVVKYWSVKEINIQIFNRWGKKVHVWNDNNVQGFSNTVEQSVWDGKIGGRYASPGVYYYVVEALGRDDTKKFAHGFVHLFREK